ncbi:MAG: proline dehydrogenase family protein [Pedobacter sp.]|jgi:proline dehydrogenase
MNQNLSFDDTEIAFRGKTNADLNQAYWLFRVINNNFLTKIGPPIAKFALYIGLPIKGLIKSTIFRQFCGGENIEECEKTIHQLDSGGVGSILDYSVEGEDDEKVFDATCEEIMRTIKRADGDERIPFTVFKSTGLARFSLLEKIDAKQALDSEEQAEFERIRHRIDRICGLAYDLNVRIMIDAEESWIQDTIDSIALEMMRRYNRENTIVFNTYQLYRNDKLASLKADHQLAAKENFFFGAKLVRGAYMEKERERAEEFNYPSPIHADKESSDKDYDDALKFCLEYVENTSFVAGTHNEKSCRHLAELLDNNNIAHNHEHVFFSQLLGMSDNLSFNLAAAGYNVVKYVPYGPVKAVLPYLFRRAEENTAVAGQMGRELRLINAEKKRRKLD